MTTLRENNYCFWPRIIVQSCKLQSSIYHSK